MASSDALPNQCRVLALVFDTHTIPTTTTTATRVAGFLFPLQRHSATKRSHLISSCTFVSTPPAVLISPRTRNGHALFAVVAIWLSIAIVLFACLSVLLRPLTCRVSVGEPLNFYYNFSVPSQAPSMALLHPWTAGGR